MAATIRIDRPFVTRIPSATKPHCLAKIDKRTREARRLRQIEHDLFEHLGGVDRASAPQRYMIERVAIDIVRLELLDAKMTDGTVTDLDARVAHALRNSTRLALRELGMTEPPRDKPPSLAGHLSALRSKGRAA